MRRPGMKRIFDMAVGFVAGAVLMLSVGAIAAQPDDDMLTEERFKKSIVGLLMAISSLSVDTELNARSIAELEARIAKVEKKSAK